MLLERGHFTRDILDDLRRKFLENLIFCSSQDKGLDAFLQAFQGGYEVLSLFQLFTELLDIAC
jgi:hypothetical protein